MKATPELELFYDKITDACLEAFEGETTDPVALATQIMALPGFPMHYPTHHYLVPAVLLTVCRKRQGHTCEVLTRNLTDALERARNVSGGSCGFYGACGAAVGVGIFWSVITDSSPLSDVSWGHANRATGQALLELAAYGGPRCCKRCTWLSLRRALPQIHEVLGLTIAAEMPHCGFHEQNGQCLKARCPFYPGEETV